MNVIRLCFRGELGGKEYGIILFVKVLFLVVLRLTKHRVKEEEEEKGS